ncbi:MAG: type II secretion system protein [Vulcanimicrobiota bacterium]
MIKKGFTLIELMIVIAIISILASIIIPNITQARQRAQLTACIENMKTMQVAMNMFLADTPSQPHGTQNHAYMDNNYSPFYPNYLSQMPVCPASPYGYNMCLAFDDNSEGNVCIHIYHDNGCDHHRDIMLKITNGSCDSGPHYLNCYGNEGWCPDELGM